MEEEKWSAGGEQEGESEEESVDVPYLRNLQSTVLQRKEMLGETSKRKNDFLARVAALNRQCYQEKIRLFASNDQLVAAANEGRSARRSLLCTNEKEFLGSTHIFIMRILLMLREDRSVFQYLMHAIDRQEVLDNKFLERFADELIFLFFADFTSTERNSIGILRHFEHLLHALCQGFLGGRYPLLFDENLMICRLIKAYVRMPENQDYMQMLFGKFFAEARDLKKLLKSLSGKKFSEKKLSSDRASDMTESTMDSRPDPVKPAPVIQIFEDHFAVGRPRECTKLMTEEVKIIKKERQLESLTQGEIISICEYMLETLYKKLLYMPLSMRYLCKLVDNIVQKLNDERLVRRKAIMDLLFLKWWMSGLMKPLEHGISAIFVSDKVFTKHMMQIVKLLRAVLYGKPFDTHAGDDQYNEYIASKQEWVENVYLSELLSIGLPELEIGEIEEDTLVVSSVCLSLENIKYIQTIMQKNINELKDIKESLSKYVGRVKFFLENQQNSIISLNIFDPTELSFKYEVLDMRPTVDKEEFKTATHLIMFQDVHIHEMQKDEFKESKWQLCMGELLKEIDLSAYYNKCAYSRSRGEAKNELVSLLRQIYKCPTGFMVVPAKVVRTRLMSHYLVKYFTENEEHIRSNMEELRAQYSASVGRIFDKQQRAEQSLRLTITALTSQTKSLKSQIVRTNNDLYFTLLAMNFVNSYNCNYEIFKTVLGPRLPKAAEKRHSVVIKSLPETTQYTLKFREKKGKTTVGCLFSGGLLKAQREYRLDDFLEEFSQFYDATKAIEGGKDISKVCGIFREYMERMMNALFELPEVEEFTQEQKESIFDAVYNYAMLKLYPRIFPASPSIEDESLAFHVSQLQELPPEHFEIKPEHRHTEIWELAKRKLRKVGKVSTPFEKLSMFADSYRIVVDSIDALSMKRDGAGADDCMPVLIYLLVHSLPKFPVSNISYIDLFRGWPTRFQQQADYCYRSIKSALEYLRCYSIPD